MGHAAIVKHVLKRGALVTAANWPVVLIQFVADTLVKLLLAVPVVGGLVLVVLLGADPAQLLALDLRHLVPATTGVLLAQPVALAAFLTALGLTVSGGALLMFLVKGGTMVTLLAGEREAGAIEQPPLRVDAFLHAGAFSLERFTSGALSFFWRFAGLGLCLAAVYAGSIALYLAAIFAAPDGTAWGVVAGVASVVLVAWIAVVNFGYLQLQIAMVTHDCELRAAVPQVLATVRTHARLLLLVFLAMLALVALTMTASVLALAALGLIAFVPFVSLAALPLQILAWVLRGVVFQYVGLTGLVSCARLARAAVVHTAEVPAGEALIGAFRPGL